MTNEELLAQYGLPADTENISEAIEEKIKERLLEDETFLHAIPKEKLPSEYFDTSSAITEALKGHYGRTDKQIKKAFGLTSDELDSIPEDVKGDVNKLIHAAKEVYDKRQGNVQGDAERLLKEKYDLEEAYNQLKTDYEALPERIKSETAKEFHEREKQFIALSTLTSLEDNLPVKASLIFDGLYNSLQSKYDLVLEGREINVFKKGTKNKVEDPSTKGWLSFKGAMQNELGSSYIEKKPSTQTTTTTVTPSKVGGNSAFGIDDELSKKLAAEAGV